MSFERLGKSNPRHVRDGLHHITFVSPALGHQRGTVSVWLPDGCEAEHGLPMVMLLHGVGDDHWAWWGLGGAHLRAAELIERGAIRPMMLVMPSDGLYGEGSAYMPHRERNCEKWIVEDVPAAVREAFGPAAADDSPLFIAGFSMGGFGALRLGAKYPGHFRGISGHASVTRYDWFRRSFSADRPFPGGELPEAEMTALGFLRRNRDRIPPVRFDCGRDDFLIGENRALHEALEAEGVAHTYREFDGRHSWEYCHEHLGDTLRFFHEILSGEGR